MIQINRLILLSINWKRLIIFILIRLNFKLTNLGSLTDLVALTEALVFDSERIR